MKADPLTTSATPAPAKFRPYVIVALIIVVGGTLLWLGWDNIQQAIAFLSDRDAVTGYIAGFGAWGPLLLTLLLSLQVVVSVIPGHVIMIVGGYLYGFWEALALHMLATVGASQLAFVLASWAGRPVVNRLAPKKVLNKWNATAEKQGFTFFLLFFWFPVVPSGIMNFVAGLSTISFWRFLAASFLGRLPGVALTTLIGSHGLELTPRQWIVLGGIGVLVFFGGRYGAQKMQARHGRLSSKAKPKLDDTN